MIELARLLDPAIEERQALLTGIRLMADTLPPKLLKKILAELEESIAYATDLPH